MIVFRSRRFLVFTESTIYFPAAGIIADLVRQVGFAELIRVSQAPAPPPADARVLRHILVTTTCLDLRAGPEAIYQAMDAKSCRYPIRRAERFRNELEIACNSDRAEADFRALQNRFAARTSSVSSISQRRLRQWREHSDIFVIYKERRPICAHLFLCDREAGRVRLMFSASTRLESREDASLSGALNRYLHWHEIQHYFREGLRTFDLGGIEDGTTPIAKFKLSFGGPQMTEHSFLLGGPATSAAYAIYDAIAPWFRGLQRRNRFA